MKKKTLPEHQLLTRCSRCFVVAQNALLHEACEEWEQFERKLKEVKSFVDKSQHTLESTANKKRTLREQHDLREKMLADITIQRKKITLSTEKLQVSKCGRPNNFLLF